MCVLKSILSLFFLLSFALAQDEIPDCGDPEKNSEVWPLVDPTVYYACDGNLLKVLHCPDGTGFRKTDKDVGCVPWNLWKCFSPVHNEEPPNCIPEEVTKLFGYTSPMEYFACKATHTPMILECNDGQGFLRTDQHEGCLDWIDWRAQCDHVEGNNWRSVFKPKYFM